MFRVILSVLYDYVCYGVIVRGIVMFRVGQLLLVRRSASVFHPHTTESCMHMFSFVHKMVPKIAYGSAC